MGLTHNLTERPGLYPMQALVQPISLRFKYHFEGTRQTNRIDKVLNLPSISAHKFIEKTTARMVFYTHPERCT